MKSNRSNLASPQQELNLSRNESGRDKLIGIVSSNLLFSNAIGSHDLIENKIYVSQMYLLINKSFSLLLSQILLVQFSCHFHLAKLYTEYLIALH